MKIGLLCAMKSELGQLTPHLQISQETTVGRITVFEGEIDGLPVAIAASGICKVNAAVTAQILIDRFAVTHVMMVGVAGGMDPQLGIHALVFSERLAEHDICSDFFVVTKDGWIPADEELVAVCRRLAEDGKFLYPAFFGAMVSGEQFIAEEGRQEIIDAWHPLSVDMESAAAAHACYLNGIPFLAIRAISDTAESGPEAFEVNEISAADAAASAAREVLKALAKDSSLGIS
ncbi:MAG: 5'-methylthioadenosine/S-adenosylhomocysteine nucleosidase [Clostridia bacterium]|nr:5'-methylthioadenosine/S-adenosylhomocysteine nucleosidase [Clostridia bacterium]